MLKTKKKEITKGVLMATFICFFIKKTEIKNNENDDISEMTNSWRLASSAIEAKMHIITKIFIKGLGIFKVPAV